MREVRGRAVSDRLNGQLGELRLGGTERALWLRSCRRFGRRGGKGLQHQHCHDQERRCRNGDDQESDLRLALEPGYGRQWGEVGLFIRQLFVPCALDVPSGPD